MWKKATLLCLIAFQHISGAELQEVEEEYDQINEDELIQEEEKSTEIRLSKSESIRETRNSG